MAAAWVTLKHLGQDGYMKLAKDLQNTVQILIDGCSKIKVDKIIPPAPTAAKIHIPDAFLSHPLAYATMMIKVWSICLAHGNIGDDIIYMYVLVCSI